MQARLILASASPRRRELLAQQGIVFEVIPSNIPEVPQAGEGPASFARRVAAEKAFDIARQHPEAFVLGADTVVIASDEIFGKPTDRADAQRMLKRLSGTTHRVVTAVALIDPRGMLEELAVETAVEFRDLSAVDIDAYLDTGEPFDKAGAYAIQGGAAQFVTHVSGSYSNVIGLPIDEVAALLRRRMASV